MTRVSHLDPESAEPPGRQALEGLRTARGFVPSVHRALAHSPQLLADFLALTEHTRSSTALDPALRELAILTVANQSGAATAWLSHLPLAREAGLSPDQLLAVPAWERNPALTPQQQAVIQFVEELTRDVHVSVETWETVRAWLDEREAVELTFIAGFYNMVVRILHGLEVDVDAQYLKPARAALQP